MNLNKSYPDNYGNRKLILSSISFTSDINSITAFIGADGSGKSTLLKVLSKLESADSGEMSSKDINQIYYIPQNPSSYPWLSVKNNIRFASKNISDEEIKRIIAMVELEGYEDHIPHNKSLGFRFRIALARTLTNENSLILIDNTFNNFNAATKSECYNLIKKIKNNYGATFIIATSNISEALYLADDIYLMTKLPASIASHFKNTLNNSKDFEIENSIEFSSMRSKLEQSFKEIESQMFINISI